MPISAGFSMSFVAYFLYCNVAHLDVYDNHQCHEQRDNCHACKNLCSNIYKLFNLFELLCFSTVSLVTLNSSISVCSLTNKSFNSSFSSASPLYFKSSIASRSLCFTPFINMSVWGCFWSTNMFLKALLALKGSLCGPPTSYYLHWPGSHHRTHCFLWVSQNKFWKLSILTSIFIDMLSSLLKSRVFFWRYSSSKKLLLTLSIVSQKAKGCLNSKYYNHYSYISKIVSNMVSSTVVCRCRPLKDSIYKTTET